MLSLALDTERSMNEAGMTAVPDYTRGRILVVDDETNICRLLERYLIKQGHEVHTAGDVPAAVGLLTDTRFDLVLTDLRLPCQSGLDLLVEVRSRAPGTRMILMSAHADVATAATAIERGIDQLIIKPFELEDVRIKVADSLLRHSLEHEAEQEREVLKTQLRQRDTESKVWVLRAAHALAAAVEAKDEYTAGHATRVTAYAITIAEVLGGIDLVRFRLAGDLHDVGKIGVPDSVLNKPGRLTPAEFDHVKKHPATGARILQPMIDDPLVLGVVRWHHERWDGAGYPEGLSREEIPLPARVLAVADTLDAMTSRRAYRDGLPWQTAVDEIRRCSGSQFDPGVAEAFEECLSRLAHQHSSFVNSAAAPKPAS